MGTLQNEKEKQTRLIDNLQYFGLDPRDWTLIQEKSNIYSVNSKSDPAYSFRGKAKYQNANIDWEYLQLAGD